MKQIDARRRALLGAIGALGFGTTLGQGRFATAQGMPGTHRRPGAAIAAPSGTPADPGTGFTAPGQGPGYGRSLILIELRGGNDGLNTLIPYRQARYRQLRPGIAIGRDDVLPLDHRAALHPALRPLMPLWARGELALIEGVGVRDAPLSHFRCAQIGDTGSSAQAYLADGWLARTFRHYPLPAHFTAHGLSLGSADTGPLAGAAHAPGFPAVDLDAATSFWNGEAPVLRLALHGFDTHSRQGERHAALLDNLARLMVTLRARLVALDRWDSTLILTSTEFGRGTRENASGGTDHGTVATYFASGGKVRGGLLGLAPDLARLRGEGQLPFGPDPRDLHATVLRDWWNIDPGPVFAGRFAGLPLLRT